jgi:hypothetical protein
MVPSETMGTKVGVGAAICAIIGAVGCGASPDQLRARAAFDMNCPGDRIQLVEIDDRTRGVTGCGQRATYVESCGWRDGYGGKHDCTWVLNTDAKARPASQ